MKFQKFNLAVKKEYSSFYSKLPPYSDFSFNNLLVWLDINDDLEYTVVNNNYVFRFSNPFENNAITYTIIGSSMADETVQLIFDEQIKYGHTQGLGMVPECFAQLITPEALGVNVVEEPDNRDYLFDVTTSHQAKGKVYRPMRNNINHFVKNNSDQVRVKPLDLSILENRIALINCLHQWKSVYSLTENDRLRTEGTAIDRYMRFAPELEVDCVGVFIENKIEAFAIFHRPPQGDYGIINHIKCNYDFKSIFDLTYYATIGVMFDMGLKYANGEQDLGIIGIRNHKKALNPINYLKRFSVLPNSYETIAQ